MTQQQAESVIDAIAAELGLSAVNTGPQDEEETWGIAVISVDDGETTLMIEET